VPNIDATGWVADVGMASVWTTKHVEGAPDPRVSRRLPAPDRDAYYLMSAPDADLFGDVDVFAMRAQWALAAGQPLSKPCATTTWAGRGGRRGAAGGWRAFASVNRLAYGRDGARIVWDPAWWTGWVRRIDRFNDVYGAGVGGSLWGTLTRPGARAWPETPLHAGRVPGLGPAPARGRAGHLVLRRAGTQPRRYLRASGRAPGRGPSPPAP
jgi:hypothetical protein